MTYTEEVGLMLPHESMSRSDLTVPAGVTINIIQRADNKIGEEYIRISPVGDGKQQKRPVTLLQVTLLGTVLPPILNTASPRIPPPISKSQIRVL